MTLAHPKPPKRISRQTPVKKRSSKRGGVVKADQEWAAKVFARDEACVLGPILRDCWGPDEAHHCFYTKGSHPMPRLRHDTDNGARVCTLHHAWWHSNWQLCRFWWGTKHPDRLRRVEAKAIREARLS